MSVNTKLIKKLKDNHIVQIKTRDEKYFGRFLNFSKDKESIIITPYFNPTDINTEAQLPKEILISEIEDLKVTIKLPKIA